MSIKAQGRRILFLLVVAALLLLPLMAVRAQTSPRFSALVVSLWPEYDRPDVLVMVRAQLSPDTPLPAQVTFRLPGYVYESMHAIAVEQAGGLVNVSDALIEWSRDEDDALLSFPTYSPDIQLEYYDALIMTREDQTRHISYTFTAALPIDVAAFEVQRPSQTDEISINPQPTETYVGTAGLEYSSIEKLDMASGDTFELSVTYRRETDELSASPLPADTGGPAGLPTGSSTADGSDKSTVLYYAAFGFAGAALGALLFWWLGTRRDGGSRKTGSHRPTSQKPARTDRRARPPQSEPEQGRLYCTNCGALLRKDARFCHACGAEQRNT